VTGVFGAESIYDTSAVSSSHVVRWHRRDATQQWRDTNELSGAIDCYRPSRRRCGAASCQRLVLGLVDIVKYSLEDYVNCRCQSTNIETNTDANRVPSLSLSF